ncbi:MAG TPA: RNA methyltransferase [Burkholderiales bacterium]|nr:RNA methyltransferase [Burkholderiales bacterium]
MNPDLENIRVVLCRTTHPGNIGAAARAMKTMGLSRLHLVSPKYFPHPEATARASGAEDILEKAVLCETLDEALEGTVLAVAVTARKRDLSHEVYDSRKTSEILLDQAESGEAALVFGTEMSGLTTEEIGKCTIISTIPANPAYSSLNLASAVQIMAYELWMANPREQPSAKEFELASFEEIEHFYRHLEDTMIRTGFLDPDEPKRLMQRMRRLFSRTRLEKTEINILRGILSSLNEQDRKCLNR